MWGGGDDGQSPRAGDQIYALLPLVSRVRLSATPWIAARQAPPSKGFSRQEDCLAGYSPWVAKSWIQLSTHAGKELFLLAHSVVIFWFGLDLLASLPLL